MMRARQVSDTTYECERTDDPQAVLIFARSVGAREVIDVTEPPDGLLAGACRAVGLSYETAKFSDPAEELGPRCPEVTRLIYGGIADLPRRDPFIYTFTGRRVNPLAITRLDLDIEDIAHALACCNRFAGHASRPISVAQHSVYVSRLCADTPWELQALLHDASEAYLGDITKWLKETPGFAGYREAEDVAQAAIFDEWSCVYDPREPWVLAPQVKTADRVMARWEIDHSFPADTKRVFSPAYPPTSDMDRARIGDWYPWSWQQSEAMFLSRYRELTSKI